MSIVQLPVGRSSGNAERVALRKGLSTASRLGAALQLVQRQTPAAAYCAACAAPIDCGAVWRGQGGLLQRRVLAGGQSTGIGS